MEQGRRHIFYKLCKNFEWCWRGAIDKEKDVICYQWYLWPAWNCRARFHHGKDTVQRSLPEKTKLGWRSTRGHIQTKFWIIQAQAVQVLKSDVGLRAVEDGILRCVGRVPNYHPVFLPRNSKLATLIVQQVHEQMLHGGVSTTMCRMRENYWIPKLRSLTKKVIHSCNVCRRYSKKPISTSHSPDSTLSNPFAVTGVDFAGPVYYKIMKSTTSKAYIALFTCASTQTVHLKLCRDLSAEEFQRALKEFVARRGCLQIILSDNRKTFVATGKWLSKLKKDQRLANYLGGLEIKWKFKLARAP